jgi:hypothetical protein
MAEKILSAKASPTAAKILRPVKTGKLSQSTARLAVKNTLEKYFAKPTVKARSKAKSVSSARSSQLK